MKIRQSVHAQGVHGLEAGHRYSLDVATEGLQNVWWRWGTREDRSRESDPAECM